MSRCIVFALILAFGTGNAVDGADIRHVVMVSIDGLSASCLDDPNAKMVTLQSIRTAGAAADSLITTFPSVTWPAHVSLVTGMRPSSHGVLANSVFDRRTGRQVDYAGEAPRFESQAIRVPTLYDLAHAAGLKSGAVVWPCSVGSPSFDWIVPNTFSAAERRRHMTPGLAEEFAAAGIDSGGLDSGWWHKQDPKHRDRLVAEMTSFLVERKGANLVLVNFNAPDNAGHLAGPRSSPVNEAVANADECLKLVWTTLQKPDLVRNSTLFVVSDHGFSPYEKLIEPNVVLKRLGLIGTNVFGSLRTRNAWSLSVGGAAFIYLFNDKALEMTAEIKAALKELDGVESVLEPAQFIRLGLPDPKNNYEMAQLVLTARPGFCFDERYSGPEVVDAGGRKGTHGQRPESADMHATFIAAGAGIKPGVRLKTVDIIDVAPTLAKLLKIPFPTAKGRPIEEILEK
jgi:predicted AlkP superfamily pyrophosphatase or phosphodiesterase